MCASRMSPSNFSVLVCGSQLHRPASALTSEAPRSWTLRPRCTTTHPRPSRRAPSASLMFSLAWSERQAASPSRPFCFPAKLQQIHLNSNTGAPGCASHSRFIHELSSSSNLNLHHHQSESTSEYQCSRVSARGRSTPYRSPAALSQPAACISSVLS